MKKFLAKLSLLSLLTASAYAQLATTTSLVGTVSDTSGKSIPNAKITAVEAGTQDTYNTTTTEQGYYSIGFVRVGTYNITVECPGFQKVTQTGILVEINQTVRTDVTLAVGTISQSVAESDPRSSAARRSVLIRV